MLLSALVDGMKAIVGMEAGELALRGHRDHNYFTEYDRIMFSIHGAQKAE